MDMTEETQPQMIKKPNTEHMEASRCDARLVVLMSKFVAIEERFIDMFNSGNEDFLSRVKPEAKKQLLRFRTTLIKTIKAPMSAFYSHGAMNMEVLQLAFYNLILKSDLFQDDLYKTEMSSLKSMLVTCKNDIEKILPELEKDEYLSAIIFYEALLSIIESILRKSFWKNFESPLVISEISTFTDSIIFPTENETLLK